MNKGTIIYYGGFSLPDKSASANRVVSNGKIFEKLGYKTVFIGASEDSFDGLRPVAGCENMFEHAHPKSTKQWLRHMLSVEHIETVIEKYGDVKKIILYNVPMFTLMKAKKVFSKRNIEVCYDCTEWTKDTDGSLPKRIFKAFDEILISNFSHRVADGMIAISSMMEKKYKKAKKLVVLPPLVDINDESGIRSPICTKGFLNSALQAFPTAKKKVLIKLLKHSAMSIKRIPFFE